jgi:hypothetical protein
MSLRQKQSKFALMVAELIQYAYEQGYEITLGHAYRCSDCSVGHKKSLHKKRLAIDLNLFKDGAYLTDGTGHYELHFKWSQMGGSPPIANDLNHYSIAHDGMI